MSVDKCPVCHIVLAQPVCEHFDRDARTYPCSNCGEFTLTRPSEMFVAELGRDAPRKLLVLSHAIRKMVVRSTNPTLLPELIRQIAENTDLPNPDEQLTNLLLWLGQNLDHLGEMIQLLPEEHAAVIGSAGDDNFVAVCTELSDRGWFVGTATTGPTFIGSLSFDGWRVYQKLRRGLAESRKAFMAMAYGDGVLDALFRDCLKPAVAKTGFDLRRLDEDLRAGLIDDRLRVEILTSRFLIADLTNDNRGAYWEAGYAEGLGKPVIYLCERAYFDERKTHFDTNHQHTVLWNSSQPTALASSLKVTIRATLPEEAVLED